MEDTDLRGRLTQEKGEYEITALDMVLERLEHGDLTVFFRAVPANLGMASLHKKKYLFMSIRVMSKFQKKPEKKSQRRGHSYSYPI